MSAVALGGPVSEALEAELRSWVRKHGIVVWLDLDAHYTAFVDRLIEAREAGALPYEVKAFRGSHLELMLSLEGLVGGTERTPIVVHLPGFNEETVRHTPLLELYEAGVRYRKALDTLVEEAAGGHVRPEQIAAMRADERLTLEGADAWLEAAMSAGDTALGAQLRAMQPTALFDDLLGGGFIASQLECGIAEALWHRLEVALGVTKDLRERLLPAALASEDGTEAPGKLEKVAPADVAFAATAWCLCVEYVADLRCPPRATVLKGMGELPTPVVDSCRQVAVHLRERHPKFYQRTADETEELLRDEVDAAKASDLGRIDTFRFEEDKILEAAVACLGERDWKRAGEWVGDRIASGSKSASYWLCQDPARQSAWQLVADAVALGQAVERAGSSLRVKEGLEEAVQAYVEHGAAVDQAHRRLEQHRVALLYPQLPQFDALRPRLDEMRALWRAWADAWARDFNQACRCHGFLPGPALQQRTLFDDVVKPMAQESGVTALFVVDAWRFEMGEELYRELASESATTVQLKPRLAELPTVTEVGMNVLAPVAVGGRLEIAISEPNGGAIKGFSTGEYRVYNRETRKRAMHARVGGATCPMLLLDDVVTSSALSLKRSVAQARLAVVFSKEFDDAGEGGFGPAVFEHLMQKLRAAWQLLRDAGVRRFVFTADHGFLLLDGTAGTAQSHGRKLDPKRRHVLSAQPADHSGEVRVPMSELGYQGDTCQLMFPETTAVFETGTKPTFVHGGNSLQERVIPVLTVVHRAPAGGSTMRYTLAAKQDEGIAGMHCIKASVSLAAQQDLDFGGPKAVELGLSVLDASEVRVELCHVRGNAELAGGAVSATVGGSFELFFRLVGPSATRVRVQLGRANPRHEVDAISPEDRFAVTVIAGASQPPPVREPTVPPREQGAPPQWLLDLPEGGVRQVFAHLTTHGAITEVEAARMLGGVRSFRRFSGRVEEYAKKAPFTVRIDNTVVPKRYLREGNSE